MTVHARPQKCLVRKDDVISYFGNRVKTAQAFGISPSAITSWPDYIPEVRARQLLEMTSGAFTKFRLIDMPGRTANGSATQ